MDHRGGAATPAAPLPGTSNTREVGGFHTEDGRSVAAGLLYRGDVLGLPGTDAECLWNEVYADVYRSLGLRVVVDLRSDAEAELVPSAWASETGARLVRAAIPEGVEGSATDFMRMLQDGEIARFGPDDLGIWYQQVLERRASVFGDAVRVLAEPDSYPALVHCHAGKDRTGLLIAVILETLGVPRPQVVHDYTMTGTYRAGRAEQHAGLLQGLGLRVDDVRTFWETPAHAMQAALVHLDTEFGGPAEYLHVAAGVSRPEIDSLRRFLLTEAAQ
ncbi:putative protein-tyrosine phosphatase [Gordonia rhizosphera NBRC 16068]|uniref:Tyrosine specific protein phosphatases domain-containing protein n=2 Tax=Gordonia rhizosphera TaxID=83341 RepID=K6W3G7_9ACTN|nr:putative protein-tyrosine phosphatase [Gordonia rhizosphera NBRC 16068]